MFNAVIFFSIWLQLSWQNNIFGASIKFPIIWSSMSIICQTINALWVEESYQAEIYFHTKRFSKLVLVLFWPKIELTLTVCKLSLQTLPGVKFCIWLFNKHFCPWCLSFGMPSPSFGNFKDILGNHYKHHIKYQVVRCIHLLKSHYPMFNICS